MCLGVFSLCKQLMNKVIEIFWLFCVPIKWLKQKVHVDYETKLIIIIIACVASVCVSINHQIILLKSDYFFSFFFFHFVGFQFGCFQSSYYQPICRNEQTNMRKISVFDSKSSIWVQFALCNVEISWVFYCVIFKIRRDRFWNSQSSWLIQ